MIANLDEEVVEKKGQLDKYCLLLHQLQFEHQVDILMQAQIVFDWYQLSKLIEHQFLDDH
jgi:hypothetical protein